MLLFSFIKILGKKGYCTRFGQKWRKIWPNQYVQISKTDNNQLSYKFISHFFFDSSIVRLDICVFG